MGNWHQIRQKSDIEELQMVYGGFHDSCITELHYSSGADVNKENYMTFGTPSDRSVSVVFKRQGEPSKIELLFQGMRNMNLAGWQHYYSCDIFDCRLELRCDLVAGQDQTLVVWADNEGFDPKAVLGKGLLAEPIVTYIIAEQLKWRLLED